MSGLWEGGCRDMASSRWISYGPFRRSRKRDSSSVHWFFRSSVRAVVAFRASGMPGAQNRRTDEPNNIFMKALVLSPGGMFGAYQAGAWKILADLFQPDLIVGASIGAVNGWAIAGGCSPDELIERWREMECLRSYRWKFPAGLFGGVLGSENLRRLICDIHGCYPPRVDFALLLTELLKLRPRIFRGAEVTSEHLIAATALVGIFDQVRIDG